MTTDLSEAKRALLAHRLARRAQIPGDSNAAGFTTRTIPARAPGDEISLSYAQERLWFMDQYAPGSTAYTIPLAVRLAYPVDRERFAAACGRLADRHEALRTRFPVSEDGKPTVVIDESTRPPVRTATAGSEDEARTLGSAFLAEPFDLAAGPVIRVLLITLPAEETVLVLALHHIAGDGWSAPILLRELLDLYADDQHQTPAPLAVQYADYARWQRSQDHTGHLGYWRSQLAGVEPLDLPTDRLRPAIQTYRGAPLDFRLSRDTADRLRALANDTGSTLYMALLAAFAMVLGRYAGQDDVVIGSPVAGRTVSELEPLIGCFVNMLSMRVGVGVGAGDGQSFRGLLTGVRETALDAYTHQELPFEHLVQDLNLPRDVSRSPLFQVIFAMQNYASADLGQTARFGLGTPSTRYDLELYAGEDADGLGCLFIYNADLFEHDTVERLARHLTGTIEAVLARPDAPLSTVSLLGEDDARLIASWNDTTATPATTDATDTTNATDAPPPAPDATLHGLIAAQATRTPDAPAVTFADTTISYAELLRQAEEVRASLAKRDIGPGRIVTVPGERSAALVPTLLGTLMSGAAYLPLDPEYPRERLDFMTAEAAAATVEPDVAYVIYTSGSTGRPKGVPNTHAGIVNRIDWMQKRFSLAPDDVVLQKTPAGFDVSVWEFFWPLTVGARVVLAEPGGHKDAAYLRELIAAEAVTTVHFVPSMLALFLAQDDVSSCTGLRRVICSGEALPVDLALRCLAGLPVELHNLYGPTEAAVDVTAWRCTAENLAGLARVPIGNPMPNCTLHVLDPALNPVPVGMAGELHIGGVQLATGYLERPDLTAERFITGPDGQRLYKTGDLARWRPDGALDYLGRLDSQVKLRGLRIELGEIETVLREQAAVSDAAVIVVDGRLIAYTVGGKPDRDALRRSLPEYMVPSAFVDLDELPLTANGKLDRRLLPAPTFARDESLPFQPPQSPMQILIAELWSGVLAVERVGLDDDFFDLGGHSLLATQVVAALRKAAGAGISVMDVFTHRTVRELAALAETPAEDRAPRGLLHELTPRRPGAGAGSGPAAAATPTLTFVCVPYGGGSAVVYQPVADALPADYALWSVAIPGHDIGLDESGLPFDELAARCAAEILEKVSGPVAVYGHCGVGSALAVDIALRLEAAGRTVETLFIGAIFPFARPASRVMSALSRVARAEALRGDRVYVNWLASMGVDMSDLDPAQARRIIRNMRRDSEAAEAYFTGLFQSPGTRLAAPIVTIAGERDPATEFHRERFLEWHALTARTSVVVLDEAGHFFIKHRAGELARILTAAEDPGAAGETWRVDAVSNAGSDTDTDPASVAGSAADSGSGSGSDNRARQPTATAAAPLPSMRRFLTVALGQTVSMIGSALTEFAVPLWVYLRTGSTAQFAFLAVVALLPGMLVAPIAGAVVDRVDRRRVMLLGDLGAGCSQLTLGMLFWAGGLQVWQIYPLVVTLSVALTFQRLAYGSAVPQLVPKRFLGHANGVVQMGTGMAQLAAPLVAVGLMAAIGLGGLLAIDVTTYAVAITVVALTRFPATAGWRRKEPLLTEITEGVKYSWGDPGFRSMLLFFAALNVFLSPLFLLISPLVLSFEPLKSLGVVAFSSGIAVFLGGFVMTAWGGPRRHRMRGVLVCTLILGGLCALTGVRASLPVVAVGAAGMALCLTILNGVYTTIVQVKVAQRFHGRVFALNTLVAWSTLPLGMGLVAPLGSGVFEPLMRPGGALAGTFGPVLGVGRGRGIGLMYVVFAAAIIVIGVVGLTRPSLRALDAMPDARPDDLLGVDALAARALESAADESVVSVA